MCPPPPEILILIIKIIKTKQGVITMSIIVFQRNNVHCFRQYPTSTFRVQGSIHHVQGNTSTSIQVHPLGKTSIQVHTTEQSSSKWRKNEGVLNWIVQLYELELMFFPWMNLNWSIPVYMVLLLHEPRERHGRMLNIFLFADLIIPGGALPLTAVHVR